jgi:RNA polymerase sigma-70 factor (ECF subfamily)
MPQNSEPDKSRHVLEDELLAVRCQLGEPEAFDHLIRRWHEPLWRFVRRLLASEDDAAEVVQDVWLRVVRGITRLHEPAKLRSWLFGIAHRVVMDRLRVKYAEPKAAPFDESVSVIAGLAADDGSAAIEEQSAQLHETLDELPVIEREVLLLFYMQELTLVQLADVLEIPVGTVKSRLFRARRLLRERLETKGLKR